jgi:hypothetical protein
MLRREEIHSMRLCNPAWPTLGPLSLLLLALLTCGCGEASGHILGGEDKWPRDPSQARVGTCGVNAAQLELIDDMEDGDDRLIKVAGRSGFWFSFNDQTRAAEDHPDGVQVPRMGMPKVQWSNLDLPRDSSRFAVQTFGSGFIRWGAGIGFDFITKESYDVSRYAGIAFWARTGVNGDPQLRVRMNVNDRNTSSLGGVCDVDCQPKASVNMSDYEDGACDDNRGPCFDDFGADLGDALNGGWQFFRYSWSELTTANWSEKNLTNIVTQAIYGVRFQTAPAQVFDLWIDDVSFLCP